MKKALIITLIGMLLGTGIVSAQEKETNTLVVYYSATGTTQAIAEKVAELTDADLFALEPVDPYIEEDLDWTNRESRVCKEHEAGEEGVELETVTDWEDYDTVYIGYPIWWQDASWVMDTFVESNDFSDKTVIPFCTSQASGYGESGKHLAEKADAGNWIEGRNFFGSSTDEVEEWIESLATEEATEEATKE